MRTPYLQNHASGTLLRVHIQPRASKTEFSGIHQDRLKIRVSSPPVDGKANAELCKFLSTHLGIPKSSVVIVRGDKGRQKDILLHGLAWQAAKSKLSFGTS